MPDGDYFNWKVKGRGSKKLVELALGGASMDIVADQGVDMVVHQLNDPANRLSLRRIVRAIEVARSRTGSTPAGLQTELRKIVGKDEIAGIAAKSAEAVFVSGDPHSRRPESRDIQERLLAQFGGDLIEARALTPARADLMKAHGRSGEEHHAWVDQFREIVGLRIRSKADAVFEGIREIRRPRRLAKRRIMTLEELHEPIARQTL